MVYRSPFVTPGATMLSSKEDKLAPPLLKRRRTSTSKNNELTLPSNQAALPSSLFMPLGLDDDDATTTRRGATTSDLPNLRFLKPRSAPRPTAAAPLKRKCISRSKLTDLQPMGLSFDDVVEIKRRRTSISLAPVLLQESRAQRRNSAVCA